MFQVSKRIGQSEFDKQLDEFFSSNSAMKGINFESIPMDGFSRYRFSSMPSGVGSDQMREMYVDLVPGYNIGYDNQRFSTYEVRTDRGVSGLIGNLTATANEQGVSGVVSPFQQLANNISVHILQQDVQYEHDGASSDPELVSNKL